jgi:penicillin-binding protein 1A
MKFEQLSLPPVRLPDLVAFNDRVRGRIDPWIQRRWIKRLTIVGAVVFAAFAGIWLYFATGLPSAQTLLAYEPPLPSKVRSYDGNPVQTFARERRVNLAFDEYPPLMVNRGSCRPRTRPSSSTAASTIPALPGRSPTSPPRR